MAKLVLALLLPIILLVAAPAKVQATAPEILVTTRYADGGLHEAIVSVTNNPGIAGYNLVIEFDNTKLTPVTISEGDALAGGMIFISNLSGATQEEIAEKSAVTAVWGAPQDAAEDGMLFSVLFHAADTASGITGLQLASRGIVITNEEDIGFILIGAIIELGEGTSSSPYAYEPLGGPSITSTATLVIVLLSATVLTVIIAIVAKSKARKRQPSRYDMARQRMA